MLKFLFFSCNGRFLHSSLSDIADVTHFVHSDTPLDKEASQRGTSVYLVDRRIDMLPKPLTEGFFSSFELHFEGVMHYKDPNAFPL